MQEILPTRLGSILPWLVYVTIPQPAYAWCLLESNGLGGKALSSWFTRSQGPRSADPREPASSRVTLISLLPEETSSPVL